MEGHGVSGDGDGNEDSGELRSRDEESHKRHFPALSCKRDKAKGVIK